MKKSVLRTGAAWGLTVLMLCLAACGGGGDDAGTSVTITIATPAEQTMVEGNEPAWINFPGTLSYRQALDTFYIMGEGDERLLANVDFYGVNENLTVSLQFVPDLPAGDYTTTLTLHSCSDEQCSRELGPAVRVPLTLHVLPNIQVQRQISLTRTGREAAPSLTIPVTVPAAAGQVNLWTNIARWDAMTISFDGTALHVDTRQLQAGTYTATATLWSNTDGRYSRTVNIEYTVLPPEGGEQAMTVTPSEHTTLSLPQGSQTVQQVRVTRPTWTDAWATPALTGANPEMATLRDLGNDVYEVTINTAGKAAGRYDVGLTFDAGPTGGVSGATFVVMVEEVFSLPSYLVPIEVQAGTTASELSRTIPIAMLDGSSRRWTASTTSPYLQISNNTGMTGTQALQVSVDPALLAQPDVYLSLPFTVSVDVPGSLSHAYELTVVNRTARLSRAMTRTQVEDSGRVYVQGLLNRVDDANWRDHLQVTGATLVRADLPADRRFLGNQAVLALDLAGMSAGQDVTVRYNSVLQPSQVQFQVAAPFTSAVAFQALPYGAYRPGQFAQGLASLYFAGPDTVYRWTFAAGNWTLTQATLAGVIDVAPAPDETMLYATAGTQLRALNPQTFAAQAVGDLAADRQFLIWSSFETNVPAHLQGLAFSADGRALSGVQTGSTDTAHSAAWVCSSLNPENGLTLLTTDLGTCDPGTGYFNGSQHHGVIRSPNGHTVDVVGDGGEHWRYRVIDRVWSPQTNLPAGIQITAVTDDGARYVRSDGLLINGDTALGNLASALPVGYEAGGYALSAAGGYGVVYGYRRTGTGAAERATDAKVWIVDLTHVNTTGISGAPLLDTVTLPQAVGCTDTLISGETCVHQAAITVAPGQRSAFIVGPRGVAVVPLPTGTAEAQVLRVNRSTAKPQALTAAPRRTLRRAVKRTTP